MLKKNKISSTLLYVFSVLWSALWANQADTRFEHLSLEQGISHNLTHAILQDSRGFMWFGTVFGLIKYDGYNYTTYRSNPIDNNSISHDDILCIYEDSKDNLWIGTRGGGLNKFNPETQTFTRFINNSSDSTSLSNNFVLSICEDYAGNIWIGTEDGLNKLSPKSNGPEPNVSFKRYNIIMQDITSLSNNVITSLFEDPQHNLWIGTNNGLNLLNRRSETFTRYFHFDPEYTNSYTPASFEFVDGLKKAGKELVGIAHVKDFQDTSTVFSLDKRTRVLLVCMGEGRDEFMGEPIQELNDFGWLEDMNSNHLIWKMTFKNTFYAGGAQKNRMKFKILTLNAGRYKMGYESDDSHSYGKWNNQPPDRSDYWGMCAFRLTGEDEYILRKTLSKIINFHPNSLSDNAITTICGCEEQYTLWIGTAGGGFNKFNTRDEYFVQFLNEPDNPSSLPSNQINTIFRDENCVLWIGTSKGTSRFNPDTETFTNYYHDPANPNSLSSNIVNTITKDQSGILWFGTYWGGIDKLDTKTQRFDHIRKNISSYGNIPENNIFAIFPGSDNSLWLGTAGSGLLKYSLDDHSFTAYTHEAGDPNSLSHNFIRTVFKDSKENVWIGTYGGGLNRYNLNTKTLTKFFYNNKDPNSLSSNSILTILEDHRGKIWIGTEGGGLNLYDWDTQTFHRYSYDPADTNSISNDDIYAIYEDFSKNLWIGTSNGLNSLDSNRTNFDRYLQNAASSQTLSNNYVYVIHGSKKDRDSTLWIGTARGLNKFNTATKSFTHYSEAHGLPSSVIYGILEDSRGFIWLSTNKGLAKFDVSFERARSYDLADGLQSNMFNIGSFCQLETGQMIFGGINGINLFHPERIISNTFIPPVFLTGFKIFNQKVSFNKELYNMEEIRVSHKDNFFTFEFAALDFTNPQKNHYAYRLKGVDKGWVHIKNKHYASYTNVAPGSYTFEVLGSNSNGVWNRERAAISIVVTPPFWLTWWFKSILTLSVILGLLGLLWTIRSREQKKTALNKKISELKLQALRAQMNPHFIFNTINSIQYFISNRDEEAALFYLSKFSKLMRFTLDNSEKSTVPLAREIDVLQLYLELQQLRFEDRFSYQIKLDPAIDIHNIEIPTLVFQPYIENALEHGFSNKKKKGKLDISLRLNSNVIICTVEDNGIGIGKALKSRKNNHPGSKSAGMKLSRERLKILNDSRHNSINVLVEDLNELSAEDTGTRITIHIPI